MYNSWEAHYRRLTVLRFTPDGEALLSGSDDSGITVWSVFRSASVLNTSRLTTLLKSLIFLLADYWMTVFGTRFPKHTPTYLTTRCQ
jgi:WD40 repeat protein